jgi:hypothetical protein
MDTKEKVNFTQEGYDRFVKAQAFISNQIYRSKNQSFYDAMRSDESDFTKTEEGKGALEAIIAFGEERG